MSKPVKIDIHAALKTCRAAMTEKRLASVAAAMQLKPSTLNAFGIGAFGVKGYAVPMVDGDRKPIGALTWAGSDKCGVMPGSQMGLLVPDNYAETAAEIPAMLTNEKDDCAPTLLIVPGLAATLRVRDLGFCVVGRPTGFFAIEHLVRLLRSGTPQDVIVLAEHGDSAGGDAYWKGIEAALLTIEALMPPSGVTKPTCSRIRFLKPPEHAANVAAWLATCGPAELIIGISGAKVANKVTLAAWRKSLERRSTVRPKVAQNV